jgi:hypothetical protein
LLLAVDAVGSARNAIEIFEADERFVRLSTGHRPEAGIDMFGLRWGEPATDVGITVYSPVGERTGPPGFGALVQVGLIPRNAIDARRFPP